MFELIKNIYYKSYNYLKYLETNYNFPNYKIQIHD